MGNDKQQTALRAYYDAIERQTRAERTEDWLADQQAIERHRKAFLDADGDEQKLMNATQTYATTSERRIRIERALRYNNALNAMEFSPNCDDFNAVIDMLNGAPYRAPKDRT